MSRFILVTALTIGLFSGSKIVYALNSSPTQLSPLDGSTVTSSILTWSASSYTLYSTTPYNAQVDDDPTFGSVNKNYLTNNLTYSPALSDGIWYWRIRSKDSGGTYSNWSDTWTFTLDTSQPSPSPTPQPSPSPSPDPTPSPSPASNAASPSPSPTIPKFEVSNTPLSINSSDSFLIDINLFLPTNPLSLFYLKGAFVKSGSTNYLGFTKVVDSWVENSQSYSYQKQIQTDSNGNWSGQIEIMPDEEDSGFSGSGNYIFKVARYTQTGSGPTWSNESTINITQPTPTPSPSPSPSPSPTSQGTTSQFQISNIPSSINSLDSFETQINISLPSNANTTFYLKGAFIKPDSSNYFGETLINDYWIKNSASYSSQLKITTDQQGNWSGDLEAMPDSDDSGFTGTGSYLFKVARYTDSGSGPTWSNQLSLNITEVPKPSPSPAPTVTPKPSPSPFISVKNFDATSSATNSASPNPDLQIPLLNEPESSVAGEAIKSLTPENQINNLSPFQKMNWWFITAGLTTITATGSFLLKNIKSFTIPQWLLKAIQLKTQGNSQINWPKSFSKPEV